MISFVQTTDIACGQRFCFIECGSEKSAKPSTSCAVMTMATTISSTLKRARTDTKQQQNDRPFTGSEVTHITVLSFLGNNFLAVAFIIEIYDRHSYARCPCESLDEDGME
jgi:hypothetical protein